MTDSLFHIVIKHGIAYGKPEKKDESQKIGREAFIYLSGDVDDYAQCSSCWMFNAEKERCSILGPDFEVLASATCCFYVHGEPDSSLPLVERVTPEEAGYVNREVRCENCKYGGKECQLYIMLNKKLPDVFDLDTKIEPRACCNAQTAK